MNRILLASVAVLGLAGVAAAQEAPYSIGNVDAAVAQQFNAPAASGAGVDYSATASTGQVAPQKEGVYGNYSPSVSQSDILGR